MTRYRWFVGGRNAVWMRAPLLTAGALLGVGCSGATSSDVSSDQGMGASSSGASSSGGSSSGGTGGSSGQTSAGGAGGSSVVGSGGAAIDCNAAALTPEQTPFFYQQVDAYLPTTRVLYSWTSAEQEQDLRTNEKLLTVGEVPGKGRGYAMDMLYEYAATAESNSLEAKLTEIFTEFRYSWPNPWATRLGTPGESYGDRLVRMKLRANAWIARLADWGMVDTVYDVEGNVVPHAQALANPERIAALYFVRERNDGGPLCGTFSNGGGGGYREFIVGNAAMIEEWSIGTQEIRERIEGDVAELEALIRVVSKCGMSVPANFNGSVVCGWGATGVPYYEALALPSELYAPSVDNIRALLDALEASLFEPDPLTVTPGG